MSRVEWKQNKHGQEYLDEIVTDAGCQFERMSKKGWFLNCHRSDGSSIAVWIHGRVTLVEERPAPEVTP